MLLKLEFCDNGVIAKVTRPASEGTLESTETLLFVDQGRFLEWIALQWALDEQKESSV